MSTGKAKQLIKEHEGLRLKPYKDSLGFLTIGYGRCLDHKPLREHEANYLFDNDFSDALRECQDNFKFFNKLTPARQAVLIDMCFNLGITKLKKFITTLGHIERGEYKEAADSMLQSLWADQVKTRALTLSNMMRSGEFKK
jgi:lysozyme